MSDVSFDPIRSTQAGFDYQQGLSDNVTRRRAGAALGAGNYSAAASALGSGGLIPEAVQVAAADRAQTAAKREVDEAEHAEQVKFTLQAAEALARVPAERRNEVYMQTIRPVMAQFGFDEAELAQLDAADKGDDSLAALRASLGGTVPLATANDVKLGDRIARPDSQGVYTDVYTAPANPLEAELLQARIDATKAQVGQREAAAARSSRPPAGRGSGSRSSSSGGRSSAPTPTRKPWER